MNLAVLPDNRFLATLRDCRHTLSWLSKTEPVTAKEIPASHAENIKRLEKVGIVFFRNRHFAQLRRQRLKRITDQVYVSVPQLRGMGISKSEFARQIGLGFLSEDSK